ncbi:glutathione S-transferase family protein [Leptospira ognonensis]|uniref:Glutathione S-transferase family protein n=1 Tax=Leptospira ognonensis TaxID=2484945 RepID=A0A4R9JTZ9_9LEPT|nr:glutathione binding-like protein [Leptospira ognonensis]TGL56259.1 glutathione S-transferase family protein [Leptospira ognonensis]
MGNLSRISGISINFCDLVLVKALPKSQVVDMVEEQQNSKIWITGENFSMADCSAVPALFYADTLLSFWESHPKTEAYFERLLERSSVKRTLTEDEPDFDMDPFSKRIHKRFRK